MPTDVEVVHFSPGRVRLVVADARGKPDALEPIAAKIRAMSGVIEVRSRALTGSILVLHELSDQALMFGAMMAGIRPHPPELPSLQGMATQIGAVEDALAGNGGSRRVAFLVFALIGIYQLARGNLFMPAATAFWYALTLAREEAQPPPEA